MGTMRSFASQNDVAAGEARHARAETRDFVCDQNVKPKEKLYPNSLPRSGVGESTQGDE